MEKIEFDQTDCWILLSIPLEKEGCDLPELIGIADMLNHSIPSKLEIETAITKGIQSETVCLKEGRFMLCLLFKEIFDKVIKGRGGIFSLVEKIEKKLNSYEFEQHNISAFKLTQKEYDSAYQSV
ncbi:hypothetical protein [Reichenbachiella sp. MALMAid0571]|uniref:hypothetical protein n=1 Tax=Reichenbachiella sp. MALMAid0571 TaxID=3143939 RepID=UPI0032DE88C2